MVILQKKQYNEFKFKDTNELIDKIKDVSYPKVLISKKVFKTMKNSVSKMQKEKL